jgi:hypothetical protein
MQCLACAVPDKTEGLELDYSSKTNVEQLFWSGRLWCFTALVLVLETAGSHIVPDQGVIA